MDYSSPSKEPSGYCSTVSGGSSLESFFEGCDDNDEILELIKNRLEYGRRKYGHGVQVETSPSKTTVVGWTESRSKEWETLLLEDALDAMICGAAAMIRLRRVNTRKN